MNLPAGSLSGWNDVDITADVESLVNAPTYLLHDVSAACLAELCFGLGRSIQNFPFIFMLAVLLGEGLRLSNSFKPVPEAAWLPSVHCRPVWQIEGRGLVRSHACTAHRTRVIDRI